MTLNDFLTTIMGPFWMMKEYVHSKETDSQSIHDYILDMAARGLQVHEY